MNGNPIQDETGKIVGSIVTLRNITERKRTKKDIAQLNTNLERSKSQLLTAQQLAHIGSWEWDMEKNEVTWSEELYRIFGLTPGKSNIGYEELLQWAHVADREKAKKIIEDSYKSYRS